MAIADKDGAKAHETHESSGAGPGSSSPEQDQDDRTLRYYPERLRSTDSDASSGWRQEMHTTPGVEPEGWRDGN